MLPKSFLMVSLSLSPLASSQHLHTRNLLSLSLSCVCDANRFEYKAKEEEEEEATTKQPTKVKVKQLKKRGIYFSSYFFYSDFYIDNTHTRLGFFFSLGAHLLSALQSAPLSHFSGDASSSFSHFF